MAVAGRCHMRNQDSLRQVLTSLGYVILLTDTAPFRVCLSSVTDSWEGIGATKDHAMADAVRRAFPSAGARQLLDDRLAQAVEVAPVPAKPATEPAKGASPLLQPTAAAPVPVPAPARPGIQFANASAPAQPDPETEPKTSPPVLPRVRRTAAASLTATEPRPSEPRAAADELRTQSIPSAVPAKACQERKAQPAASAQSRHALYHAHLNRITQAAASLADPELFLSAPPLVKLKIAYVFFCVRAAEHDAVAGACDLPRAEAESARLSAARLAAQIWPGSVETMQHDSTVGDAYTGLTVAPSNVPLSWKDAADSVADLLREPPASLRHLGWRDADKDHVGHPPTAEDCRTALRETQAALHLVWDGEPEPKVTRVQREAVVGRAKNYVDILVDGALQLRWIRDSLTESDDAEEKRSWGRAIGRLRQIVSHARGDGWALPLQNALEPSSTPTQFGHKTWAQVTNKDPHAAAARAAESERQRKAEEQKVARQVARHRLVSEVPVYGSSPRLVEAWLEEAVPVMTNPEIAGVAYHLRPQLLAVDPDRFEDRQMRSRLRRLAKYLDTHKEPLVEAETEEDEEAGNKGPQDPVIDKVRSFLCGKKVMFVSNRQDQKLQDLLETILGIEDLDFREAGDPRRVQAAVNAVSAGDHDILLLATGFNSHTVDHQLAKAAKKRKIPYIRVSKGRPLAVAMAIEQALAL